MLALNVVEPNASGLGGGGFMVIRNSKTGEVVFLDYREVAPASATKDMYASQQSKDEKCPPWAARQWGVQGQLFGIFAALRNTAHDLRRSRPNRPSVLLKKVLKSTRCRPELSPTTSKRSP